MKKIISMILAIMMISAVSVCAFAEAQTYPDPNAGKEENFTNETTVPIPLYYVETNEGSVSPAETFNFKVEAFTSTAGDPADMPAIANFAIAFQQGDAQYTSGKRMVKDVPLPTGEQFGKVGLYTYKISQIIPAVKTAGVTYDAKPTFLKLTVIEQSGLKVVAAVHYETEDGTKIDGSATDLAAGIGFTNIYSAAAKDPGNSGSEGFTVKNVVTGNFGDKTKDFDVTVTFTAPEGALFTAPITFVDGDTDGTAVISQDKKSAQAKISLKDGETVRFSNVPYGTTFTVVEDDYTAVGKGEYDAPEYSVDEVAGLNNGSVSDADVSVVITNNKGVKIDTGVFVDSIPYIVILGIIVAGAAVLVLRKKPELG